jgi:signal transduction histidine kinase
VEVAATCGDDHLALAVSDDGPGIPAEIRDRLFEPFVRAGEAPTSTGLGLSVVRAVAEAHGGEVIATTGEDGTRIELRLPWSPTPDEDATTVELPVLTADATPTVPLHRSR